jgi:hypothetical protein
MNKGKIIGILCGRVYDGENVNFLAPFMNAFVGFWDIIDFSLSRAFSQEIFGFLEFLTRGIRECIK